MARIDRGPATAREVAGHWEFVDARNNPICTYPFRIDNKELAWHNALYYVRSLGYTPVEEIT